MTNYIYVLHCPLSGTVRYVGKTVNPDKRLRSHVSAARTGMYKHHTSAWIRKLLSVGLEPLIEVVDAVEDGERWQDLERRWIAEGTAKGWKLTNSTAGGEGLDYICPQAAAAYKANLSVAMSNLWNLPERRQENRIRSLRAWADPDVTARRKASQQVAREAPDTKAKYVAAGKEIGSRPEVKEKRSKSLKAAWADPERKERWVAATTTPEVKRKQSEAKLASWKDPEFIAKQAAGWTEERRMKQATWPNDPERKAKIDAARNSAEYKEKRAATIRAKWIEKNKHLPHEEFARKLAHNDRVSASRKAAALAAVTPTPYTESS
ncbi:GIY-YIG catalytic domain protein [compost metagenome]